LSPRLFQGAPRGAFSLRVLYDRAETEGRLFGLVHEAPWLHIGSAAGLKAAEAALAAHA